MLLDLHNLYANSVNFGFDPFEFLSQLLATSIRQVHISGGCWIDNGDPRHRRLLDDHLHDPPDPVYDFLPELAARCPNPLTAILERDGSYPPMDHLSRQLDLAREAMIRGRLRNAQHEERLLNCENNQGRHMSSPKLEEFLAAIYVDTDARARFLANPRAEDALAGLAEDQCLALESIDRIGLAMAVRSYTRRREHKTTGYFALATNFPSSTFAAASN